ncbi:Uncharacterized protein TCM_039288 [Theobroma cacao]|uniref:Uncharacterized protein n=1 Tax=Theobroma cacao TaxID=3641 RepID=A0A061GR85_THECC|nr:Uncharacterized protein TCM_039288 [Theobroma cacao]
MLVLAVTAMNFEACMPEFLPFARDVEGSLTASLEANASTIICPWQPFRASPMMNMRLYDLFGTMLRKWAMAFSLPAIRATAAFPAGTLECFESMNFAALSD